MPDLRVNGHDYGVEAPVGRTLAETLRDDLGLTGTKIACGEGHCGACTVLLDGRPVLACITLALECDGAEVRTVEGLAEGQQLAPLQEAFLDHGAVQCGFCTSGMLMSATALLERDPKPDREAINKALEGNLCRCTGYNGIVEAVLQVSGQAAKPDKE